MDEIIPSHNVTKEECQKMIDAAMRKHNRNASLISMTLGLICLALFVDGLLRILGIIPPFMDIDINVVDSIIDKVEDEVIKIIP